MVGGMLTGQSPDCGSGLLPGRSDGFDGLVRVLGQGRDESGHRRVRRHRAVDTGLRPQDVDIAERFTAEGQRQGEIKDDLARIMNS